MRPNMRKKTKVLTWSLIVIKKDIHLAVSGDLLVIPVDCRQCTWAGVQVCCVDKAFSCLRHVALPIYTLAQNHWPPVYQQDASKVLRQMSTDFQRSFSSKFVIKLSLRIAHILNVFVLDSAMQRPAFLSHCVRLLLWPPYGIGQTIIFFPCGFYLSFFFSLPYLSGRRLDVYHTSTHGVALVRI